MRVATLPTPVLSLSSQSSTQSPNIFISFPQKTGRYHLKWSSIIYLSLCNSHNLFLSKSLTHISKQDLVSPRDPGRGRAFLAPPRSDNDFLNNNCVEKELRKGLTHISKQELLSPWISNSYFCQFSKKHFLLKHYSYPEYEDS